MSDMRRIFSVDGRPFFPVGAQAHNQIRQSAAQAEKAFQAVREMHGNTLLIPDWRQAGPGTGVLRVLLCE
jgi:hypothetical protein